LAGNKVDDVGRVASELGMYMEGACIVRASEVCAFGYVVASCAFSVGAPDAAGFVAVCSVSS